MTNLESLYWSEEFSDMELHAIADAGDSFTLTQTEEQLELTLRQSLDQANGWICWPGEREWFKNNRDTQW